MRNLDRRVLGLILTSERIPTRREIAAELGVGSTDTIQRSVDRLEADGFIAREPRVSRGLTVKALP